MTGEAHLTIRHDSSSREEGAQYQQANGAKPSRRLRPGGQRQRQAGSRQRHIRCPAELPGRLPVSWLRQVIKGWLDNDGELHERVYDVAVSGGRRIGGDGRARDPVGNTVDIPTATFTNTIGDPVMTAYWADPDFDPSEGAFYYVRVLEIPTPRWTTYDAAYFGIDLPDNVPATIQDRAYTSPIWYTR